PEQRPKESPLVAEKAARFLRVLEGRLAFGILGRVRPELLVGRQRRERERAQRDVVGALGRKQIPVVLAAELVGQRNPGPGEVFELLDLGWIDDIAKVTGDHSKESLGLIGNWPVSISEHGRPPAAAVAHSGNGEIRISTPVCDSDARPIPRSPNPRPTAL